MIVTRRQAGLTFFAALAAAPTLAPLGASAAGPVDDADPFALPNMFISPAGEPFRGKIGEPYASALWFAQADTNHDGKLDRAEFVADAAAFFKKLDSNGDGALSRYDVALYEHNICPEIIGRRVVGSRDGARLWLAQMPSRDAVPIAPSGSLPPGGTPPPPGLDETGNGASPFSFFDEPEPILTADFNVDGVITRQNFLKLADMHFTSLDPKDVGYLTLAHLPKTQIEKILLKTKRVTLPA
jgi:hypothetical protein